MEGSVRGRLREAEGPTFQLLVCDPQAKVSYWILFFVLCFFTGELTPVDMKGIKGSVPFVPFAL